MFLCRCVNVVTMKKKILVCMGAALAIFVCVLPMKASADVVSISTDQKSSPDLEAPQFPAAVFAAARATSPVIRAAQAVGAVVGAAALGFAEQFGSNAADRVNGGDTMNPNAYTLSSDLLD